MEEIVEEGKYYGNNMEDRPIKKLYKDMNEAEKIVHKEYLDGLAT